MGIPYKAASFASTSRSPARVGAAVTVAAVAVVTAAVVAVEIVAHAVIAATVAIAGHATDTKLSEIPTIEQ
jgi:hypothetical protein